MEGGKLKSSAAFRNKEKKNKGETGIGNRGDMGRKKTSKETCCLGIDNIPEARSSAVPETFNQCIRSILG